MEIWKKSPLAPDHVEVSSLGRARTLDRVAPSRRDKQPTQIKAGVMLSPWSDRLGYQLISVKVGDKRPKYAVHRLVASAFCDGYLPGLSVNHIDGVKANNLPENLEWVSLETNTALAWVTGQCKNFGEGSPHAKLTVAKVREIRRRVAAGESCNSLAKHFGVSPATIYYVRDGKRWARVA